MFWILTCRRSLDQRGLKQPSSEVREQLLTIKTNGKKRAEMKISAHFGKNKASEQLVQCMVLFKAAIITIFMNTDVLL